MDNVARRQFLKTVGAGVNDPPADFKDPQDVKVVQLDAVCRRSRWMMGALPALTRCPLRRSRSLFSGCWPRSGSFAACPGR
jgi:hypothetical protein